MSSHGSPVDAGRVQVLEAVPLHCGMRLRIIDEVTEFALAAGPFLRAEPFSANVISVHMQNIVEGRRVASPGSSWIVVDDDGAVAGAAMHTPPHNLFVPRLRPGIPEVIAAGLTASGRMPPGVNGEAATVDRFAREWEARTGQASRTRVSMRMYVLRDLQAPEGVAGSPRLGSSHDLERVATWLQSFWEEAMLGEPDEDHEATARRRLAAGQIWLWDVDGETVSLAAASAPAVGVARVGPVYTPRDRRGHGYGSAVTAAASEAALAGGAAHVVLYTDLANPVSNSIYRTIGYVPEHDAEERDFVV